MKSTFLEKLLPQDFLENYWNKKPLLIKNAIANPGDYASADDFIEMSKDEYFETRMVYEQGGDYPWQAKLGPFTDNDFPPNALWTLICHNLELLNSDFFALKKNIRFIPDWNFDDLMATISVKGASVGAHIDDYSVFIIQGVGSRKWLLEENANPDYIPNLDIKLLKEFKPNIEWVLEPGDMIYIPPNVAHHGITLENSISYSLGFKSIRYKDLLDHHISQILSKIDDYSFHDQNISLQTDPFLLQDYVIDNIYEDLLKTINDKETFKKSLLMYLSRPKNAIENVANETAETILKELKGSVPFKRDIWAKLVAQALPSSFEISINARLFNVSSTTYQKMNKMFLGEADDELKLRPNDFNNQEFINLMISLIEDGVFYFC